MTTETIDKLFLELSLVTTAKTAREIQLERERDEARAALAEATRQRDGFADAAEKRRQQWEDMTLALDNTQRELATTRAERDEARAERDALHVALELAEVEVALDRSWCRICRTECRGAHRGRREHMHATECVLNIRAHAAKAVKL